ncbi:hypothetical protein D915_005328 [Fasciola hepatica]|uniref:Fibronectin type III domain protein n=1 Tax=Fasciola hepatica TaxID=6192 RepID=A0A4E0RSH9_FASHE|nr:hypothetical protein D915_005328 [Fasciola hepatica]
MNIKVVLVILSLTILVSGLTNNLYVQPHGAGARISWPDPIEPTSEFLLLWFKDGMGRIEGHKFIVRTERGFTVRRLEPCAKYVFWLYGFDWNYEINGHWIGYLNTAGCASDMDNNR